MKVILKLIMFVCCPYFECYRMNTIYENEKCDLYLKEMKND